MTNSPEAGLRLLASLIAESEIRKAQRNEELCPAEKVGVVSEPNNGARILFQNEAHDVDAVSMSDMPKGDRPEVGQER